MNPAKDFSFPGFDRLKDLPHLDGLSDKEAAHSLSGVQLDLMFKGSAFEDAARRARERNDRVLLANLIGKWRAVFPRLVAGARARQALLDSPAGCLLLERVVELFLHPACTPQELEYAAQRVHEQLGMLK